MKKRPLLPYLLALLITLVLGYSSRMSIDWYPDFWAEYAGDTLWAMLVYWIFALLLRSQFPRRIGLFSLLFAFGIELSQLYQAEWITALRNTFFGSLVLGHGFLWSDLVCYSVGIGIAFLLDRYFLSRG
ncbi:MAG: DUF2809 domain-containing protein [Bacteroidota bacterium]